MKPEKDADLNTHETRNYPQETYASPKDIPFEIVELPKEEPDYSRALVPYVPPNENNPDQVEQDTGTGQFGSQVTYQDGLFSEVWYTDDPNQWPGWNGTPERDTGTDVDFLWAIRAVSIVGAIGLAGYAVYEIAILLYYWKGTPILIIGIVVLLALISMTGSLSNNTKMPDRPRKNTGGRINIINNIETDGKSDINIINNIKTKGK